MRVARRFSRRPRRPSVSLGCSEWLLRAQRHNVCRSLGLTIRGPRIPLGFPPGLVGNRQIRHATTVTYVTVSLATGSYEVATHTDFRVYSTFVEEVDMPSSTLRRTVIGAILCTACAMHSAAAQDHEPLTRQVMESSPDFKMRGLGSDAESQTSSWSSHFGCANKNKISEIWRISGSTFVGSNLLTEKSAQTFAQGLLGGSTSAAGKAVPYIYSVAKSAPWKTVWALVAISAGGLLAFQFVWCE